MRLIALLLLAAFCGTASSQQQAAFPCRFDDKECAAKAVRGHPVTKVAYWQNALGVPVEERMGPAPPELVEYLKLDNIKNGYVSKPAAIHPPDDFVGDVRDAIEETPAAFRRLLAPKLAGIYFVKDLGSTGYSELVLDSASKPVAGFIALDAALLARQTANAWATWKENTAFKSQSGYRLDAEIETAGHDNRRNAIQYILLHELSHIVAINENIHPDWTVEPKNVRSTEPFPFFRLSWSIDTAGNRYVTIFDAKFPQRKDVVYYLDPKLGAAQMVATYANLERTNFPTLYAATNPFDDFAEALTTYVHTVLMKKPFAIRIYAGGRLARIYRSCWTQQRCAQKRKLLERLLAPQSP